MSLRDYSYGNRDDIGRRWCELSRMWLTERATKILLELQSRDARDHARGLDQIRHTENEEGKKMWTQHNGKWRVAPNRVKRNWWE